MIKRTESDWGQVIDDWKKMNISMAAYCRQKEISYWSFRENIKKRTEAVIKQASHSPLVKITPHLVSQPEPQNNDRITIVISEKITLQIPDGFNKDTLQRIIDVLGDEL
ncbi:MAG: hypothetical protein JW736_03365 [Deltaproteobacteria bacterium]|nr:hypothetical protein [Deltaproteobacteria bacterium]